MNNNISSGYGSLYRTNASSSELKHYGVPGMKWGHRKIKVLTKKERKLTKRLGKEEKRYRKALSKYTSAQTKGASANKLQKLQLKEQAARGNRNLTQAKLDTTRKGRDAAIKMMDAYADSPKTASQLASSTISRGSATVQKVLRGK